MVESLARVTATVPEHPRLNSYDEWSTLRQVIIGDIGQYEGHHLDPSFAMFYFENIFGPLSLRAASPQRVGSFPRFPRHVIAELKEDLNELVSAIQQFGATVLRPATGLPQASIRTPYWTSRSASPLNVRDQVVILGSTIVETAPHIRARLFENDALKPIFYDYFAAGADWISMPRPTLGRGALDPSYFIDAGYDISNVLHADDAGAIPGLGFEMVFDGAQCIRMGQDVLVNVANQNHLLGYQWLERVFGSKLKFHKITRLADSHIDSIVLPLCPGTLLVRSPEFTALLPEALHKWKVLYSPEPDEARFPEYRGEYMALASKYIDMNVLSLSPDTVIVNSLYPELIRLLEQNRFTVIPVRHRHRRLIGGGFHCLSLDCHRDGGCESYLQGP